MPVVGTDGRLVGIVEAHDLLKGLGSARKVQDVMRHDYIVALPKETVDEVTRDMVIYDVDNIVVVEGYDSMKPIGVARAGDILRLRRLLIEEEGIGNPPVRIRPSHPPIPGAGLNTSSPP